MEIEAKSEADFKILNILKYSLFFAGEKLVSLLYGWKTVLECKLWALLAEQLLWNYRCLSVKNIFCHVDSTVVPLQVLWFKVIGVAIAPYM